MPDCEHCAHTCINPLVVCAYFGIQLLVDHVDVHMHTNVGASMHMYTNAGYVLNFQEHTLVLHITPKYTLYNGN